MQIKQIQIEYEYYENAQSLSNEDALLLGNAREAIAKSYAPYSKFNVGAAFLIEGGAIVTGANFENASYPVGLCAERVVMGAVAATYPHLPIKAVAIFVKSNEFVTSKPSGPCGLCRQTLLEYELRFGNKIRIILAAETGSVIIFESIKDILPYYFEANDLNIEISI